MSRTKGTARTPSTPPCLMAILFLILALTACGGGGGSSGPASPSGLSYPGPLVLTKGVAITPANPTVTGTVTGYTVSPNLPGGLVLDATTGSISGTPTVLSAGANYRISASNPGGATVATVSITVNDVKPAISYGSQTIAYAAGLAAETQTPTNTGGGVTSWSISPTLPAGLTFNTTDGSISGTPTTPSSAANYVVSATNSGGAGTTTLGIVVSSGTLLDLGHAQAIIVLRVGTSRVLSEDLVGHWVLWDYASATSLASGDSGCTTFTCPYPGNFADPGNYADLKGAVAVVETPTSLEVRSIVDGHVLSTISGPPSWWQLATDGSYITGGTSAGLTVWNTSGGVVFTRAGDYSKAVAYAAPSQVQVAKGAAGQSVIETIAVPAGTTSTSPSFQGQFSTWFGDGQRFLTSLSGTVWVYSNAAAQLDVTTLPTQWLNAEVILGGFGKWFWGYVLNPLPNSSQGGINIYAVGASTSPAASYPQSLAAVPSGSTLGLIDATVDQVSVIDLSGTTLAQHDFTVRNAYNSSSSTYSAINSTQWMVGNVWGVVMDPSQTPAAPRCFSLGNVLSIAANSNRIAVSTASGSIQYFDATGIRQGTIGFTGSYLQLSADGNTLAAAAGVPGDNDRSGGIIAEGILYDPDRSINLYTLPGSTPTSTLPYTFGTYPYPTDFTLSGSGTVLAMTLFNGLAAYGNGSYLGQVIAVPGGAPIWSDTTVPSGPASSGGDYSQPIALSPDGTLIAVSDVPGVGNAQAGVTSFTEIIKNGTVVATVPGGVATWLDNNRLLVTVYLSDPIQPVYSAANIYDSTGQLVSSPPLPEIDDYQVASTNTIYSATKGSIYSLTDGSVQWKSANLIYFGSVVTGTNVIFVSGTRVLIEPY